MATDVSGVTNSSGTNGTSASSNSSASATGSNALGKDAFLTLLVTQMENQDPTNPTDNTQYISELAQFSSLEQMENLNTTGQLGTAASLIGATVSWTNASGDTQSGVVGSVKKSGSTVNLVMNDGSTTIDMSTVTNIQPTKVIQNSSSNT